jgi:hypothetical protein
LHGLADYEPISVGKTSPFSGVVGFGESMYRNPFDVYGNFSNLISVMLGIPQTYYRLQMP